MKSVCHVFRFSAHRNTFVKMFNMVFIHYMICCCILISDIGMVSIEQSEKHEINAVPDHHEQILSRRRRYDLIRQ